VIPLSGVEPDSDVRKAKGIPWMLPESVVSGVLMSACASTQMTQASEYTDSVPAMVPMARE